MTTFLQARKIAEDYSTERAKNHTIECMGIEFTCRKTRKDLDIQNFVDFFISYFDEKKFNIIKAEFDSRTIEMMINTYPSPDIEYDLLRSEEIAVLDTIISEAQEFYSPCITICIEPNEDENINTNGLDMEETKDSDISNNGKTLHSVISILFLTTDVLLNDQLKDCIKDAIRQWAIQ